ncbi:MAG: hypothetical protein HYZ53_28785 [Planctomycetes bacterium]|nr:hypothetical protein [Planctomycetota bacterium]
MTHRLVPVPLLSLALLFVLCGPLPAWGRRGHELVNDRAIGLLPPELRPFFERHRPELLVLANEPDLRKQRDPQEGPRHFLDLDAAGDPAQYPRTLEEAMRRFGAKRAVEYGVLPWHIGTVSAELTAAMKAGNEAQIVDIAGRLGHYVGDSFVPLHACLNYDGQLTGNTGIHKLWEADLLERYPFDKTMLASLGTPMVLEDPVVFAFETLTTGQAEVQGILECDTALHALRGKHEYFEKLRERTGALADRRLGEAATATASHWLTAWVRAGKPAMPAAAGDGAAQPQAPAEAPMPTPVPSKN